MLLTVPLDFWEFVIRSIICDLYFLSIDLSYYLIELTQTRNGEKYAIYWRKNVK